MATLNYSQQLPQGLLDKLALRKRQEMFARYLHHFPAKANQTILDVGVTADEHAYSSNYFEKYYPYPQNIIALSNQDASFLETLYPGLTFKRGDALELPFADNAVDIVVSSAVIEHVGSYARQKQLLAEAYRVARRGVFLTTPNRWYPLEVHTLLPFIHWLPKPLHRKLLHLLGLKFYANENNLNLLDKKTLLSLCDELQIKNVALETISLYGMTSNFMLFLFNRL